jgi:hypothetical protein
MVNGTETVKWVASGCSESMVMRMMMRTAWNTLHD